VRQRLGMSLDTMCVPGANTLGRYAATPGDVAWLLDVNTRCTLSVYVLVIAADVRPNSTGLWLRLLSKLRPFSMLSAVRLTCLVTFSDRRSPKIRKIKNKRIRGSSSKTHVRRGFFTYADALETGCHNERRQALIYDPSISFPFFALCMAMRVRACICVHVCVYVRVHHFDTPTY